ncbi:hypothetical protein F2P45_08915 [Massilia sp. CCM 8733]|uniref:Uncharacterized protein n=1 Tax=Massilia mucilaginosa TaxID=2609282 RepID=A0ABX0NQN4_9BURK|nr:hypothetical protein [Massilia mucilaginosa]NHZ89137.1 hypothetical protein [Massilia mucilaginosa]
MEPAQPPGKRPLSVWLLLLVLAVIALLIAFGAISSIWMLIALPGWMNVRFMVDVAIRLAMVAFFVGALIGVAQRRRWGRWLGLLVIAGLTLMVLLMPDTARYDNEAQRSGGAFGRMILAPLLMALWAYRFGLSAKARRYFAG